ncbi:MAG: Benzoate--CoA ligase, partial [Pseudomonadota bacterium]
MALPSAPPAQFNFAQFLIAANNSRKDKTALIDDVGSLTYGEMGEQIRACAAGLRKLGLKREERVLLLMQDSTDWVVSFLGALYAGVVPVAVNTLLTADDYAFMINNSRAQAALVSASLLGTLNAAMAQGTKSIKHVVVSRHEGDLPAPNLHFKDLLASAAGPSLPAETHADEPAFWLFSSGSTGNP